LVKYNVILPAAGRSTRFGVADRKKVFVSLHGQPVWWHSARAFARRPDVASTTLVISPDDQDFFQNEYHSQAAALGIDIVCGGETRTDSISNALAVLPEQGHFVAIHDAARPGISAELIDTVFANAAATGAAILALPVPGTIKRADAEGFITDTIPRDGVFEAQTPQVFRRDWILEAYDQHTTIPSTDDAQLMERLGKKVAIVRGSLANMKITTRDDLLSVQRLFVPV